MILNALWAAGCKTVRSSPSDLKMAVSSLNKYGSAIARLGDHMVVVDGINSKCVQIRVPYHGIAMTVTLDAFLARGGFDSWIQIKKGAINTL